MPKGDPCSNIHVQFYLYYSLGRMYAYIIKLLSELEGNADPTVVVVKEMLIKSYSGLKFVIQCE